MPVEFKIDSRAIAENIYRIIDLPLLAAARETLHGHNPLNGSIQGNKRRRTTQHIYVILDLEKPLLGRPSIEVTVNRSSIEVTGNSNCKLRDMSDE